MSMLKPNDVYVPGRFPINQHNIYAHRGMVQQNFQTAINRGFVPLVFGSYGVGKSSMARYCTKQWDDSKRLVYIESTYGKSLGDILTRILEVLGYEVTVERQSGAEHEAVGETGFEIEGGFLGQLKARVMGKISRKRKKTLGAKREVVVKSPTDGKVLDLCEEHKLMLLIDEMHRASDQLRGDLSAFLKAFANRNPKHFKIAIIGTETDANRLVIRDPGIDRLIQEVHVQSITEQESHHIVYNGMARLRINVPEDVGRRVITASVGSPFIVQYLCLEMAERCFNRGLTSLDMGLLTESIQEYARSKAQRIISQYRLAIETTGERRYRKQILHAMAHIEDDYVTMEQLVTAVSKQLGEEIQSSALSGPLRQLKQDEWCKVLADVLGPSGASRAYNYSAFSDPAMKSVIRMIEELATPEQEIPLELQMQQ